MPATTGTKFSHTSEKENTAETDDALVSNEATEFDHTICRSPATAPTDEVYYQGAHFFHYRGTTDCEALDNTCDRPGIFEQQPSAHNTNSSEEGGRRKPRTTVTTIATTNENWHLNSGGIEMRTDCDKDNSNYCKDLPSSTQKKLPRAQRTDRPAETTRPPAPQPRGGP